MKSLSTFSIAYSIIDEYIRPITQDWVDPADQAGYGRCFRPKSDVVGIMWSLGTCFAAVGVI